MKKAQNAQRFSCVAIMAVMAAFGGLAQAQSAGPTSKETLSLKTLPAVKITVLVENMAGNNRVLGEWGIAFFIDAGGHNIMFDTGGKRTLAENAKALRIDLAKTEAVVISHGHDDHINGIPKIIEAAGPISLFIHPTAFTTKYWKLGTNIKRSDMPLSREQLQQKEVTIVDTAAPTEVCEGMMVTGRIPRLTDYEDTGVDGLAFLDQEVKIADPIEDDQALFFRAPEGVVIVLGCCHSGVVNTMEYVCKLLGENDIYAVIGGSHLADASPERIAKTVEAMKQHNVRKVMLSHCTGPRAFAEMYKALPGRCTWPSVGTRIKFGSK